VSISPDVKSAYAGPLSPEYALLGLLAIQPDHGYNLHQRLVADLGQIWHISLSQTYNILNRLKAQGYITEILQDQEKRPSRRQFHLTPAGRQRFEKWFDTPSRDSVRSIRVEFTTRLYFANTLDAAKVDHLIDEQVAEIQFGLERLRSAITGLPPEQVFNRLGLELRISQLESIAAWLEKCRHILTIPKSYASTGPRSQIDE
jgi:PadR family transcriptional regulator, regulatory protein AphA